MKNRSHVVLIISIGLSIGIIASPVWAGKVRNRWEGVAIGVGAAILGKMFFDQVHRHHSSPRVVYGKHRYHEPDCRPPRRLSGHWEIRNIWVPPVCERVWNPGHYNRRGRWITGKWILIEKEPGYWKKERIWVSHGSHVSYHR